ncbi:MAG: hypothetical protein KIT07_09085 [Anaerolineales bacterium]|nr:hypothetical protein [Anaerolineales bacterium]
MTASASQPELRLRWILPVVLLFSLWVNYQIANAGALDIDEFAPLILRPARFANYGRDAAQLAFPAVNPELYNEVLQDQANAAPSGSIGAIAPTGQASPTGAPSQTSTPPAGVGGVPILPSLNAALPTLIPPLVPTVLGIVPSVVAIVPTSIGIVPTVINVVPTVVNVVPTVVNVVPTALAPVNTALPVLPTLVCTLGILC